MSATHDELTAVTITVTPRDNNGDPYTPTTARFRLDDCLSGKELIDWTAIAVPSISIQISIAGSLSAIVNNTLNTPEKKVLTFNADNGLSTQSYSQYIYKIKNLGFAQVA